jgi:TolB-like protein
MMQVKSDLFDSADFGIEALTIRPSACLVVSGGSSTRVEPKVMEVLVLLAQALGENITREQLIDACWDGRIVSEDAISRTLSKARKIGALTSPPAFRIETRPKIGVRLVAATQVHQSRNQPQILAAATTEPLLIVFPFENLSSDTDMTFFSDGVSEEVLSRIIRGSKIKVVGPASSFQLKGASKQEVAEKLKATHIVDGSVRRAGDRVRINAHLTEVGSGAGLWAEQFERDLTDIFALQDEIADGIAKSLFAKFTPASLAPIDPATYDLYLRARDLETNPDRLLSSIASLERVTQAAPEFADGWGRLATLRALHRMNTPYQDRADITDQLRNDIARCHALDPENPQANYANFWLKAPFGEFLEKERIVEKALSRTNQLSDDLAMSSFHYLNVGRLRQAHVNVLKARGFDPSSWAVSINYAVSLWSTANPEASLNAAIQHVETWPFDQQGIGLALVVALSVPDWLVVDRLTDPKRLEQFPLREHGGILLTASFMRSPTAENKQLLFDIVLARAQKRGAIDCTTLGVVTMAGLGQQAYDKLAYLRIGPTGAKSDALGMMGFRTFLLFLPANKEARDDPRFVTLCARLGLVEYWLETELWPDCADEVPYDFRAACLAARDVPKDMFGY